MGRQKILVKNSGKERQIDAAQTGLFDQDRDEYDTNRVV